MSTLTTHTTASRDSHSIGLCKFNTTSKAIEVSDGTNWMVYNYDRFASDEFPSNSHSAYFDNTNDYISIPTISELNSPSAWSFACWFRYQGTPSASSHVLASAGSGISDRFYIELTSTSNIRFGNDGGFADISISTVNNTTWYHLALVQSGTSAEVYLNGTSQGTATVNSPNSGWGSSVRIGQYFSGGFPWSGYLDEVAIFDSAISGTEVNSIYNDKIYPSRFAFWRMDGDATDNEGNYNGTNNGVSFVTSTKPY
jgi:hypothetical protein